MPDGADLIRLRKVPVDLDGKPNPLALLDAAGPCSLNGNLVTTGEDYDAWRYTLEKTVRKELERSWRVFTRDPAAVLCDHHRYQMRRCGFSRPPRFSRARGCRASG